MKVWSKILIILLSFCLGACKSGGGNDISHTPTYTTASPSSTLFLTPAPATLTPGVSISPTITPDLQLTSTSPEDLSPNRLYLEKVFPVRELLTKLAWSLDGAYLALAVGENVVLYDGNVFKEIHTLKTGSLTRALAFDSSGEKLATGSNDGSIRIWEISDGRLIRTLVGHPNGVTALAFNQGNDQLVSAGDDAVIRLWNLVAEQPPEMILGGSYAIPGLSITATEGILVYIDGNVIRLRNLGTHRMIRSIPGGNRLTMIELDRSGKYAATSSIIGNIEIWDLSSENEAAISLITVHAVSENKVRCLTFHSRGNILATGWEDGSIRIWNLGIRELTVTIQAHKLPVIDCKFRPDDGLLASIAYDGGLRIWELVP